MDATNGATTPALNGLTRTIREFSLFQAVLLALDTVREACPDLSEEQLYDQLEFQANPNEPQILFKLEPYTLDPSVSRAEFRLGHQQMEYRHGPVVPASFKWPTDADDGRTSLVLEKIAGRALGLEENTGPWSLFRLFDLMQTEYLRGRDVMILKANVGGLRANYLLTSQRSPNPFDLSAVRRFRLPGQL